MTGMAGVGFMKYAMLAAMFGLWSRYESWKTGLFYSPSDYFIAAYLAWIIFTTGEYFDTAKEVLPFAVFYFVTALSLDSFSRLSKFLSCWLVGLVVVVVFALSADLGMELAAGSSNLTTMFDGRLALNTWIFNNPNSLGHGVVALIPFSYAWLWWKRPAMTKLLAIGIMGGAGYCVFLTQSKGAYLCGAAAFGLVFTFRKRLIVQILLVTLAMTGGVAALKLLPRMNTLSANEDGIAGRLVIWQMAHNAMVNTDTGEGWKKFEAWVSIPKVGLIKKATHGSYVNVGADLGYPGLLLFVAVLYCGLKVLIQARPPPENTEVGRMQRALLSLAASYCASAWVIDRAYHTDFFFIAGAIAAFHRLASAGQPRDLGQDFSEDEVILQTASPAAKLLPAWPAVAVSAGTGGEMPLLFSGGLREAGSARLATGPIKRAVLPAVWLAWRRIGVFDILMIYCLFEGVLYLWEQIMTHFISF